MPQWYYMEGPSRRGPLTADQARELYQAGRITPQTLVYDPSTAEWVEAAAIDEFRQSVMIIAAGMRARAA
jgi:hypothetical protein